jgi:aminomethyltransferase
MGPRTPPLHDRHVAAGARLGEFSGWTMPLEYAGGGVLAEHAAVRTGVGLFDVSHLGTVTVRGPGAAAFLDGCLTNDLARLRPGRVQYTLCCLPDGDPRAGGVVDDLLVLLRGPDDVLLVPNAANAAEVAGRLAAVAPAGVTVTDRHGEFAVLAVQGPRSAQLLSFLGLPGELPYLSFVTGSGGDGAEVTVSRTGYTGEHGYELLVPADRAGELWDVLVDLGRDEGLRLCGLGARDTLRTEMGYPLHGAELSPGSSPLPARLDRAVGWGKPDFWGREALLAERDRGPARLLWGLRATGRGIPRRGMPVLDAAGTRRGEVTSGTFSPTLRTGIALALLDSAAEGEELVVDVRGRPQAVEVVRPPFVPSRVR